MSTTSATAPTEQERSPRAVVRQSGITSAVAMLGVFSGLLLDLAWTSVFGLGKESDAWVLALRVPLSVTAIAMVVANQVLVPTFAAWSTRLEQREQARAQSAVLLAVSGFAIALATLLTVFARPIVAGIAPGFAEVPGKLELAATMTQIIAWYIPCVLMAEVLRCWLNAHLVVGFPAAMTLVLNLVAGSSSWPSRTATSTWCRWRMSPDPWCRSSPWRGWPWRRAGVRRSRTSVIPR